MIAINCTTRLPVTQQCSCSRTSVSLSFPQKNFTQRPPTDDEMGVKILDRFTALGGNFIDTADMYSSGQSEELIGRWLQGKDRHQLVLTTKLGSKRDEVNPNQHGLSRKHIAYSIDKSLKNLQTDFVDMYMVSE